ncbi:MAG: hypothetical protein GPJ54_18060 [Candidatus Heimdallarchaeota archaeon]|nr:hypothetical protein [Candidatus Heimdallarchaeota archaeon]
MTISISKNLDQDFPELKIATLSVKNIKYHGNPSTFNEEKRKIEEYIRENYQNFKNLEVIKSYNKFFNKFGKIYPIQYQIKSILDGKGLPSTVKVVEAMFMSELKSMLLTAGHDEDKLSGDLIVKLTAGGEQYNKINQRDQSLKVGDIICEDQAGIISSVLYGPDYRTKITENTQNCLFFSYFPYGANNDVIRSHFEAILKYIELVCDNTSLESNLQIL